MQKINLFIIIICFFSLFSCETPTPPTNNDNLKHINTSNYTFSKDGISKEVLNNYLSRAVTQTEILATSGFFTDVPDYEQADNERMIINIGAKFIGRSIYQWSFENFFNNNNWLYNARQVVERMHSKDPDIVFQAGLFENVTTKVNDVPVPEWVFKAFNKKVEIRNFKYQDMLNSQGKYVNRFGAGQSIPDISKEETRMWYYFMATKYIEIGVEALHFGVVELTAMNNSVNYTYWADLLKKVRDMAKLKARRGYVICDGHMESGGIIVNGQLLFDYVSFPLVPKEKTDEPKKATIEKFWGNSTFHAIYGRTVGGITPSGWKCDHSSYLVEFDNMGISSHPGQSVTVYDGYVWGYDEITWFYLQPTNYRNEFLEYAASRVQSLDSVGFLQIPTHRVVEPSAGARTTYKANTQSSESTIGRNQEEIIKSIFKKSSL